MNVKNWYDFAASHANGLEEKISDSTPFSTWWYHVIPNSFHTTQTPLITSIDSTTSPSSRYDETVAIP